MDAVLVHRHEWVGLVYMGEAREGGWVGGCVRVRAKFNKQTHIGVYTNILLGIDVSRTFD